jgi:hypothetical protein
MKRSPERIRIVPGLGEWLKDMSRALGSVNGRAERRIDEINTEQSVAKRLFFAH